MNRKRNRDPNEDDTTIDCRNRYDRLSWIIPVSTGLLLLVLVVGGVYYTYEPPTHDIIIRFTVIGANRGFRLEIDQKKWEQIAQPGEWEVLERHDSSLSTKTQTVLRDLINHQLTGTNYCIDGDWSILEWSADPEERYVRLTGTCNHKDDSRDGA